MLKVHCIGSLVPLHYHPLLLHHLLHPNDDRGDDEQGEDDSLVEAVIGDALVCKFTKEGRLKLSIDIQKSI